MKYKKKSKKTHTVALVAILFLSIAALLRISLSADVEDVVYKQDFKRVMDEPRLAAVLFTNSDKEADVNQALLDDMEDAFYRASKSKRYNNIGLQFVHVDLAKSPDLMSQYDLVDYPFALMLFKDGREYATETKLLTSVSRVKNFINENFGKFIDQLNNEVSKKVVKKHVKMKQPMKTIIYKTMPQNTYRTYRTYRSPRRYYRRQYYDYDPYYYDGGWYGPGFGFWGGPWGGGIGFGFGF